MRDFDEPQRAVGPGVVVDGPPHGPTVLVIDPAGAGTHGEIPATWRELTEHLHIVWLRTPAAPQWLSIMDDVLSRHHKDKATLDIVTSGPLARQVLDLAARHRELVRSVLLIDPDVREVPGVDVRVVAVSSLPLGHPDVVLAVVRELLTLDTDPEPRPSLAWEAVRAVWRSLMNR